MSHNSARIISLQIESKVGDKEYNLSNVEKILQDYFDNRMEKTCDLIVLPEFFNTGVSHDAFVKLCEEESDSETIEFGRIISRRYNTNIILGTIIETDKSGKLFNTSYVLNRDGCIVQKYRKINLFNYLGGTEGQIISKGNHIKVAKLDFASVGLSICFDIRYPQHYVELLKLGAQIIVCPCAWLILKGHNLSLAIENWKALNKVRAIESLAYFVCANQAGDNIDNRLVSVGNSSIVDFEGNFLSALCNNTQGVIEAEIDLSAQKKMRSHFNFSY